MIDARIEKAVETAEAIAEDPEHGYDQENRTGPDFDCSSLIAYALHEAGFDIAPYVTWTGNLPEKLERIGYKRAGIYDPRRRGDIFVTRGKHTVMCVDADNVVHASINESGKISGGRPGDQSGKEICVRDFYTPSYGWQYHYTFPAGGFSDLAAAIDTLAIACIRGRFGNGHENRSNMIYSLVKKRVNEIMKGD